jgi:formylglycine-generating enzyme required for sulfatase activity
MFFFGGKDSDFSPWANVADRTFATFGYRGTTKYFQIGGDVDDIAAEGVRLADRRFDDGGCVTMPIGSCRANALGLFDMHGNAAEWTATDMSGEKVVKGGSFLDRPARCTVNAMCSYPPWQKGHNVGFRVVVELSKLD